MYTNKLIVRCKWSTAEWTIALIRSSIVHIYAYILVYEFIQTSVWLFYFLPNFLFITRAFTLQLFETENGCKKKLLQHVTTNKIGLKKCVTSQVVFRTAQCRHHIYRHTPYIRWSSQAQHSTHIHEQTHIRTH